MDAAVPDAGLARDVLQVVAPVVDAGPVTDALQVAVAVALPDAAAPEQQDELQAAPAVADALPAAASRCSVPDALPGAAVPPADVAVASPDGSPVGQQFQAARDFPARFLAGQAFLDELQAAAVLFLAVPAQAFPVAPRAAAVPSPDDSPAGAAQIQGWQRPALAAEPRVRGTA